MTTRAEAALAWARSHRGIAYNAGADRLTDPPEDHTTDCSGFVWRSLRHGAALFLPPVLSWTQAAWCYDQGESITVSQAFSEPGALVFQGPNRGLAGYGPTGHVALTVGDGKGVLETPSAGHVSGLSANARGRNWTGGGRFPGWSEVVGEPPAVPGDFVTWVKAVREKCAVELIQLADEKALLARSRQFRLDVETVQQGVNLADDESLKVDGVYGPETEAGVLRFQRQFFLGQPWEQDGQAGPHTNGGLAFSLRLRNQQQ